MNHDPIHEAEVATFRELREVQAFMKRCPMFAEEVAYRLWAIIKDHHDRAKRSSSDDK